MHVFEKAFNDMRNCSYWVENKKRVVRTHRIIHARFMHFTVYVTHWIYLEKKEL